MSTTPGMVKIDPSLPPRSERKFCPNDQVHTLELSSNEGLVTNDTNVPWVVYLVYASKHSNIREMWGQPPHTSVACTAGYLLCVRAIDNGDIVKSDNDNGNYTYWYDGGTTMEAGRTFYISKMSY